MNFIDSVRRILTTDYDSGLMRPLQYIAHRFTSGHYEAILKRDLLTVAKFSFNSDSAEPQKQRTIDLFQLEKDGTIPSFSINPASAMLLQMTDGKYGLKMEVIDTASGTTVFHSDTLESGDYFAIVAYRPGSYKIRNTKNGKKGKLVVTAPKKGDYYKKEAAVSINCDSNGFSPSQVSVTPGRGITFQILTPSRISVDGDVFPVPASSPSGKVTAGSYIDFVGLEKATERRNMVNEKDQKNKSRKPAKKK